MKARTRSDCGPMRTSHRNLRLLAVAIALQTTIAGMTMAGGSLVNMVLIAVVYAALAFGPFRYLQSLLPDSNA